jgi:hypothetical protein
MRLPTDIANRAIDALPGLDPIGDIEEGSQVSQVFLRAYLPTLKELLRTANWSWARKRAPLDLLACTDGSNPNVQSYVEPPWRYAYAWPIDGIRPRWLPWSGAPPSSFAPPGNIPAPASPAAIMPNLNVSTDQGFYPHERPARFLVTATDRYPVEIGAPADWNSLPNLEGVQGVGPVNSRIVLTNVQHAHLVYTYLALDIEMWDELFEAAMVSVLASRGAMLITDPKLAIAERNAHIMIAKDAIRNARVASAQEAGWPQSINHTPDWLLARRSGHSASRGYGDGPGVLYYGWESVSFADGSVF